MLAIIADATYQTSTNHTNKIHLGLYSLTGTKNILNFPISDQIWISDTRSQISDQIISYLITDHCVASHHYM